MSRQCSLRLCQLFADTPLLQNEKRQLQTALVVEQRVGSKAPLRNDSFTDNRSELDSDTVSDDAEAESMLRGGAASDDDEDLFVDCEPLPCTSLEGVERSGLEAAASR